MGMEISFKKGIKLSEVEVKTNIKVKYNKSCLLLIDGENEAHISEIVVQNSEDLYINTISVRGSGLSIAFKLILAFQVEVITDEDYETIARGEITDYETLFKNRTIEFGFEINDRFISLSKPFLNDIQ
jgi:hypothetical protein